MRSAGMPSVFGSQVLASAPKIACGLLVEEMCGIMSGQFFSMWLIQPGQQEVNIVSGCPCSVPSSFCLRRRSSSSVPSSMIVTSADQRVSITQSAPSFLSAATILPCRFSPGRAPMLSPIVTRTAGANCTTVVTAGSSNQSSAQSV